MKKVFVLIFISGLVFSCKSKNKQEIAENTNRANRSEANNRKSFELHQKSLFIIQLDSLQIKQMKKNDGEDDFYAAADDLLWYNSILLEKMDSLNIPVEFTDADTIEFDSRKHNELVIKDSTFSIYTYFFFDGNQLIRRSVFELLDE